MLTTRNKIIAGFIFMILLLVFTAGFAYVTLTGIVNSLVSYRVEARTAVTGTAADARMRDAKDKISNFILTLDAEGTKDMDVARARLQDAIAFTESTKELETDTVQLAQLDTVIADLKLMGEKTKTIEQKLLDSEKLVKTYIDKKAAAMNDELTAVNSAARASDNAKLLALVDDAYTYFSSFTTSMELYNSSYLPEDGESAFALIKKFTDTLAQMSTVAKTSDEHNAIIKISESAAEYHGKSEEIDAIIKEANAARSELGKASTEVSTIFDSYTKSSQDSMNAIGPKIQDSAEYSKKLTTITATVGIVIGAVFAIWIIMGVIRVLSSVSTFSGKVANGDFNAQISIKEGGEIGSMVKAIMAIPATLKDMAHEYEELERAVEHGALDVQGSTEGFSGGFKELVSGANNIITSFTTVINSLPSPVLTLDKSSNAIFLNAAAKKVAGEDYRGKSCKELFLRDDYGTDDDALVKAMKTMTPASAETRAHPKGVDLDVTYSSIPMRGSNGELACVLQLITDITALKTTQRTIIDVASQANEISNRVAVAAEELSSQVEEVSRGTDIQRDRAASTATAMEEMNATVLEVAKSAGEASEQADGTSSKAQYGVDMVNKLIHSINQVNSVAGELSENMRGLGEQAEAIGGVMEVISDIADQTNLLALNAAIEAARAGEAGRGFAVVADEVRKLAEKTMSATSEVGSSIKGIQNSTTTNIARVEEATRAVNDATGLANTSGEALQEILHLVANNSAVISGIATAAEEQSATSEEINRSVEEVNRIAVETAHGMAESSAAVQELSEQAQQLRVLLDRLRSS